MSNVFSNTSFAVLSVMENHVNNKFLGATAFVQVKPEENYPQITTISFAAEDWDIKDFQVQDRFNANIASNINSILTDSAFANSDASFISIKSNLSTDSYAMSAVKL